MQPFIGGGDMIREVRKDTVTYNDPPMKFEAGTPGIVQTIGLGVALEYMILADIPDEIMIRGYCHVTHSVHNQSFWYLLLQP
jgi:selenocysteine lyase/cysteine desulfurase